MFFLKKNWPSLAILGLFRLFSSFQTNITIFTTNKCEKCPSSLCRWDSNPRTSEYESPPITTWPGLLPMKDNMFVSTFEVRLGHIGKVAQVGRYVGR